MRAECYSYAQFNLQALLSLAKRIRSQTCTTNESKRPEAGLYNWAIFLTFADGVEWVFRSPKPNMHSILTEESASKMLISEAATLKYIRACSSVPVPEVYSFSGKSDNDVGVPYILMSKASGRPLSEYDWSGKPGIPGERQHFDSLPMADHDREKVMTQLGVIMSRLAEMHFDKIGSLFEDENGSYSIGECLTPSLIWQLRDELEIIDRGPFDQESQYFYSMIAAFVAHAKEFYLGPHIFFAPTPDSSQYPYWASFKEAVGRWRTFGSIFGDSKNRLSFCIAGDFLSEMVPRLISTGPFVLSHPDLHCGNIFVDDDFNITSIIDWSSASTGPLTELLAIPERNDSFLPPKESLVAAFRSGFCQGGQTIEPEQWRTADKIWHFTRLVRMLSVQDYVHFKALYDIVYEKDADDIPQVFYERSKDERGRALYAELLQDEMEWEAKEEQTRKKEEDNDRYVNKSEEPAIAMKLKLMSEMNHNFIADKRLWQWIEKALRPADSTESCVQLAENIDPIGK